MSDLPNVPELTPALQKLMQEAGIPSFKTLAQLSGVSELQLRRLRRGEAAKLRLEVIFQLASALQVTPQALFALVTAQELPQPEATLKQEYQRLQQQLLQQEETLKQEFQQASLEVLESWLKNWALAKHRVQEKAAIEPITLVRLVQPVENLIANWGIEAIGRVDEVVDYNPQWHELKEGSANSGESVQIIRPGYRQGDNLLYRAQVKRVVG